MSKEEIATYPNRLIHIRLSDETHRRLKILVAEQGGTMQELVSKLIEQRLAALKGSRS